MTRRPPLTPLAESLPSTVPFVGPEAQERASGKPFAARIGANENGFGPSPKVIAAMREAAPEMWKYGDPENHELKAALAAHCGVKPENIVIGGGIDGLLELACRLYVTVGTPVASSLGAYPTFHYHANGFGGRLAHVPYRNDHEDLEGLLEAAQRENAPVAYLSNPDNPMGTWHAADAVQGFIEALPETTMLFLDEAYCETGPATPALEIDRPNVIRFRTFSKAYGLAGMRCGYAIGEAQTIRAFEKVRNQYGMARMSLIAGMTALADQDWLAESVGKIAASRARLAGIAAAHGLKPITSAANFVAMDCGRNGAHALKILQGLVSRGVFVRKPMAPGLDRCIRVSCGPEAEMAIFEAMLGEAIRDAG